MKKRNKIKYVVDRNALILRIYDVLETDCYIANMNENTLDDHYDEDIRRQLDNLYSLDNQSLVEKAEELGLDIPYVEDGAEYDRF